MEVGATLLDAYAAKANEYVNDFLKNFLWDRYYERAMGEDFEGLSLRDFAAPIYEWFNLPNAASEVNKRCTAMVNDYRQYLAAHY